jgi:hypothetical protein
VASICYSSKGTTLALKHFCFLLSLSALNVSEIAIPNQNVTLSFYVN